MNYYAEAKSDVIRAILARAKQGGLPQRRGDRILTSDPDDLTRLATRRRAPDHRLLTARRPVRALGSRAAGAGGRAQSP